MSRIQKEHFHVNSRHAENPGQKWERIRIDRIEVVEKLQPSYTSRGNINILIAVGKSSVVPHRVTHGVPYDPATPPLATLK